MTQEHYTFEQVSVQFVAKAANYTAGRYRYYGVDRDDVSQEIYLWLYGEGKARVERWLESDPQQTTRIYRSMLDKALAYAEKEKAQAVGYDVDDLTWYSPSLIEGLMPLVLDETFTGVLESKEDNGGRGSGKPANEGGDLLAMIVDIRKAVGKGFLRGYFADAGPDDVMWDENVRLVVDRLGGSRPGGLGRRKVMSNATAQSITREQS